MCYIWYKRKTIFSKVFQYEKIKIKKLNIRLEIL